MIGKVGPHEGRELDLMLAGEKKLAFFQDWIPEEDFAPHVAAGTIVEAKRREPGWPISYTYYALADHAYLVDDLHGAIVATHETTGAERERWEHVIGALLGYTEEDVEAYLDRVRRIRAGLPVDPVE